jgi:hypothetical protein
MEKRTEFCLMVSGEEYFEQTLKLRRLWKDNRDVGQRSGTRRVWLTMKPLVFLISFRRLPFLGRGKGIESTRCNDLGPGTIHVALQATPATPVYYHTSTFRLGSAASIFVSNWLEIHAIAHTIFHTLAVSEPANVPVENSFCFSRSFGRP